MIWLKIYFLELTGRANLWRESITQGSIVYYPNALGTFTRAFVQNRNGMMIYVKAKHDFGCSSQWLNVKNVYPGKTSDRP